MFIRQQYSLQTKNDSKNCVFYETNSEVIIQQINFSF